MITHWQGKWAQCGSKVRGGGEGFKPPPKGAPVRCLHCAVFKPKEQKK